MWFGRKKTNLEQHINTPPQTRNDFLRKSCKFEQNYLKWWNQVEEGTLTLERANELVEGSYQGLKDHPYASDCLENLGSLQEHLMLAHEEYLNKPIEDRPKLRRTSQRYVQEPARSGLKDALVPAGMIALGCGLGHLTGKYDPITFGGLGIATMTTAYMMNYWRSEREQPTHEPAKRSYVGTRIVAGMITLAGMVGLFSGKYRDERDVLPPHKAMRAMDYAGERGILLPDEFVEVRRGR